MPAAWYNMPEAKTILAKITPDSVVITQNKQKVFVWALKDDSLESRLDVLRGRCVDALLGYNYADKGVSSARADAWFEAEESQASVNDRLRLRFGDPNLLQGYGIDSANRLWERDPFCIERADKIRKSMARVQGSLERVGRV